MKPLDGLRVLDASNVIAGPLSTAILADFGADVIKVEHPVGGDPLRNHGPAKQGRPLWWAVAARNKRCVTLNLSRPEGQAIFLRLARDSDVVVESFRPGTMESWGLGYADLARDNEQLIMCRVSGFGQEGPYSKRPGFGTLAEAFSGFAFRNGRPEEGPTLPPFGVADTATGMAAAIAVLTALQARDRGAGGQVVDLSIFEPLMSMLEPQLVVADQTGQSMGRAGNRSQMSAPRNLYEAADGRWVAISTSTLGTARRLLEVVGHPELCDEPWFASASGRAAHADELDAVVGDFIGRYPRGEVLRLCAEAGTPAAPVYDAMDLLHDPHVGAIEAIAQVEDPVLGSVRMPNVLFRMSKTPGEIRHTGPEHGEHNREVFGAVGLDDTELTRLQERGVI